MLFVIRFVWCSEEMKKHHDSYWARQIDIASSATVERVKHSVGALGRSKKDALMASQLQYVTMQAADIFHLGADVAQLGLDQRKVNMLAREYVRDRMGLRPPIVLSHHMIPGLQKGGAKASKSDPMSAMFCEDTEAEIQAKIKAAYCPPPADARKRAEAQKAAAAEAKQKSAPTTKPKAGPTAAAARPAEPKASANVAAAPASTAAEETHKQKDKKSKDVKNAMVDDDVPVPIEMDGLDDNPIMVHFQHIVCPSMPEGVTLVEGKSAPGRLFKDYEALKTAYLADQIDPMVLKATLVACINRLLEPVRRHFRENPVARDLAARVRALRPDPSATAKPAAAAAAAPAASTHSS